MSSKANVKRVLMIPDTHRPYHDKRAVALLLKVARAFKFDSIVVMGDYGDFYQVSSHDKDPNRVNGLEQELVDINKGLDELDALRIPNKIFIAGNHEDRLERYLKTKAPELFNMVKVEKLLKLKQRGWRYVAYKEHARIGKIYFTHDTGKAGKYAHYQSLQDFQDNVVIAHTHRMGYAVEGSAKGVAHVTAMLGWLGDVKQVDYMHRIKAERDWTLGFGIGYLESDTGNMHIVPTPIIEYKVVVEGKLFKG